MTTQRQSEISEAKTLLVRHAELVATMDDGDGRIPDGGLYVVGNVIRQVGPTAELPPIADEVIDARGMVVLPGLVNTHHHFSQTLTRAVPAAQNAQLFAWLVALYPIWAGLTPEAIAVSTKITIAELLLSGCTTTSDHTYLWPNGARLDDEIEAAVAMGIRFHVRAARCPLAHRRAVCRPTTSSRMRRRSCATAGG